MKFKDTTVAIGGVYRCCFRAFDHMKNEDDVEEGQHLTCKYCNGGLKLRNGAWIAAWKYDEGQEANDA